MLTILVLVASLLADAAIGMAAYKMSKASQAAVATNTDTNAKLLNLITKHDERLVDHEIRIVILEKKAA